VIHLSSLAKTVSPGPGLRDKVVLQPTTLSLPADRRLAVLGGDAAANTVFLRLLARAELPTHGTVVSRVRLSPVVRPGRLFHPVLTSLENVRFYARMLNLDAKRLASAIGVFAGVDVRPSLVPEAETSDYRRALETALLILLPYECYLVDEIARLEEPARQSLFAAVAQRRGGIIFTTGKARLARQLADCAVVIRNGIVHPFSQVEEAIAFHGR
jgi:capsular polysaccharide transport system ATP-binding protein